jgi:hypothetical protein
MMNDEVEVCSILSGMPCEGVAIETVDVSSQIVYTINMIYEWDENKRRKNFEKHGYDLADGQLVYESSNMITIESHEQNNQKNI